MRRERAIFFTGSMRKRAAANLYHKPLQTREPRVDKRWATTREQITALTGRGAFMVHRQQTMWTEPANVRPPKGVGLLLLLTIDIE